MSLCRDLPFAPSYLRDTLRVYYGAKELFVEKEISQGKFTIPHASLIDRKNMQDNHVRLIFLKMYYQELIVCQGGKKGLAINIFPGRKNYVRETGFIGTLLCYVINRARNQGDRCTRT